MHSFIQFIQPQKALDAIEKVMDRDTFFDPTQALEFGVIDRIITKRTHASEGEEGKMGV